MFPQYNISHHFPGVSHRITSHMALGYKYFYGHCNSITNVIKVTEKISFFSLVWFLNWKKLESGAWVWDLSQSTEAASKTGRETEDKEDVRSAKKEEKNNFTALKLGWNELKWVWNTDFKSLVFLLFNQETRVNPDALGNSAQFCSCPSYLLYVIDSNWWRLVPIAPFLPLHHTSYDYRTLPFTLI